jgi:hypothetical protein
MSETDAGRNLSYSFRPSLVGGTWSFRLGEDDLYWDSGSQTGRISYDDITRVRLSYQPRSMQRHRFLTELRSQGGPKVSIFSTSWKSISELERLDRPYHDFVVALHRRLGARGRPIEFIGGINPVKFWIAVVLFVPLTAGIIGVAVRAFQQDAHVAAMLIIAFLALFLFQGVNYFRRNRPVRYRPDAVPQGLLPSAS